MFDDNTVSIRPSIAMMLDNEYLTLYEPVRLELGHAYHLQIAFLSFELTATVV
jgi:hypothetical protein